MPADRIVTVTLNPAIDRVLEAPQFRPGEHLRATRLAQYPAGKGINVSRVLGVLGSRSIATGFVGRDQLAFFEERLEREGQGKVVMQLLIVRGQTRENITIMDPVLDTETHIREQGFKVRREDVRRVLSKVGMLAQEGAVVAISGSLPPGVTPGDLRTLIHRCADQGAMCVIDTSERVLPCVRGEPIWMAKLNNKELAVLADKPTETFEQVIAAARSISRAEGGTVANVIATRGPEGAVLIPAGGEPIVGRAFVHPGLIASTVGCGDALLAGVLHEWTRSHDWEAALRLGIAAATANAISRERGSIRLEDIEEYTPQVTIESAGSAV